MGIDAPTPDDNSPIEREPAEEGAEQNIEIEPIEEWERKIVRAMDENILGELTDPTMVMELPKEVSIYDCLLDEGVNESRNIPSFTTEEKRRLLKAAFDWAARTEDDESNRLSVRVDRYSVADGGGTPVSQESDFNPDDLFDIHFVINEPTVEAPASVPEAEAGEMITETAVLGGPYCQGCMNRGRETPETGRTQYSDVQVEVTHINPVDKKHREGTIRILSGDLAGQVLEAKCDDDGDWVTRVSCEPCTSDKGATVWVPIFGKTPQSQELAAQIKQAKIEARAKRKNRNK